MSDQELEPIPSHIADLLARESRAYSEDARTRQAVLKHVERAVVLRGPIDGGGGESTPGDGGAAPSGSGGDGGSVAGALKAVSTRTAVALAAAAFAGGVAVGGTVASNTTWGDRSPPPISTPSVYAPAADASDAHDAEVTSPSASPSMLAAAPEISVSSPGKRPKDGPGDLTRERELLDVARASLARGNPNEALAAAERHAQTWPRGFLSEEREVVWIQALVAAGRRDEAARRAARFRAQYPKSVLLAAVDAATASKEIDAGP